MEKFEEKLKREYSEKHFFNALFDKYKEPLYIYNSFSRTNSYELTPETSYLYVYSDVLERYYRMKGLNVLYQTGINNLSYSSFSFSKQNALDYKDTLKFKSSLSNLHIGFDSNYFLTLSDAKVLLELDTFFHNHFNKEIFYTKGKIYSNKAHNRFYNDYEIEEIFDKYYSKYNKEELNVVNESYLYVDVEKHIERIIEEINNLNIEEIYKKKLYSAFGPYEVINIPFKTSINNYLDIELKEPEFMAGISFVALNPKYINVFDYVDAEEKESVDSFIAAPKDFCYSGITCQNPFNGNELLVIISTKFNEAVHVGIPSVYKEDEEISKMLELDIVDVYENDIIINSDFLNGLTKQEANKKIVDAYIEEDFAKKVIKYKNTKFIISNPDETGAPVPFETINDGYDYKPVDPKYYPLSFNKFGKLIYNVTPEVNIDLLNITFNHFYQTGILKLMLNRDKRYLENKYFLNNKIEVLHEEEIIPEILGYIIFSALNEENIKASNYYIIKDSYPKIEEISLANNLNICFVSDTLNKFSSDAMRLYIIHHPSDTNFEEVFLKIGRADAFLNEVKEKYKEDFAVSNNETEGAVLELSKELNNYLLKGNINLYAARLEYTFLNIFKNKSWTENSALIYLKLLSLICPTMCEEIFEKNFNESYLIFEEWPIY